MDHLRRGLSLGSGPDEKVASDFMSVPDPIERRLRQCQTPSRGDAAEARAQQEAKAQNYRFDKEMKKRIVDIAS